MTTRLERDSLGFYGIAHMAIDVPADELDNLVLTGTFRNPDGRTSPGFLVEDHPNDPGFKRVVAHRHNAFVDQGLAGALDSMFGDLVADTITHIGVSGDDTAVTGATTTLGTPNSIKTTANTARVGQTASAEQTWTQADVNFEITKIGLLRGATATDVSNIIGGTGGAAPYDEPFTIGLTNITQWTLTLGVDVTATAS